MRIGWREALCILAIAVATLQLHADDRGAGCLALPMLAGRTATGTATMGRGPDPALRRVRRAALADGR